MTTQERDQLLSDIDAIVDTYGSGEHPLPTLIELRRNLAVLGYRLSTHIKQVYGDAGMAYAVRKFTIAREILKARKIDASKPPPMNVLEVTVMEVDEVKAAQKNEIDKDASKEDLRGRLDFIKQVLAAIQQEISVLSHEQKHAQYQNTH